MTPHLRSLLFLSLLSAAALAQGVRFRDEVFPQLGEVADIPYGSAVNIWTGQAETLRLDRYVPLGDSSTVRPAVVVIHGGGFVSGDKGGANIVGLSRAFARRGYVAVSINYRLAPSQIIAQQDPEALRDSIKEDGKAAVRFLRSKAGAWGLDPERIAAIGSSAGAYTALATTYVPGEGQGGNPGFSSQVQAVISLWGGMLDVADIEAGEAPVCVIHGTLDPTVPFAEGLAVHQQAQAVGVPSELHPIVGAGHGPWGIVRNAYLDDIMAFCWEHLNLGRVAGLRLLPGASAPGTADLEATGLAGDLRWMGIALGSVVTPLPGLGDLCLDPQTLVIFEMPALATAPRLPSTTTTFAVPAQVAGMTFWVQEIHADDQGVARTLTGCVAVSL